MSKEHRQPLKVTLPAAEGELVRDFADAQKCTYASAVCACVRHALQSGGPTILDPFGVKELIKEEDGL